MSKTAQYAKDAKHDQSRVIFNDGEVSAWVDASGTAHLPPVDVNRLGPNGRAQLSEASLGTTRAEHIRNLRGKYRDSLPPSDECRELDPDEQTMDHVQVREIRDRLRDGTMTLSQALGLPGPPIHTHPVLTPDHPSQAWTPELARAFYRDLNAKEDRRDFWIQAGIITASAIVGGVVYALFLAAWDAWVGK